MSKKVREEVTKKDEVSLIRVTIVPETWILAPLVTKDQLKRWREFGWIDDEGLHLDRAFPRNSQGLPIIFKRWLRAPMIRACYELAESKKLDFEKCRDIVNNFSIVDDRGIPTEYVVIPKPPLRYRRYIAPGKSEFFEYIDSTTHITFNIVTKDPKTFLDILGLAGQIGLMGRTKHGFGKFTVRVEVR
jgi:hypothetical protein